VRPKRSPLFFTLTVAALAGCAVSHAGQAHDVGVAGIDTVTVSTSPDNQIVKLTTKLIVPRQPSRFGTLFVWPGLQPDRKAANFWPIGNGVLQSVLTWGPSCVKRKQPRKYSTWWISAQYVNDDKDSQPPRYRGCHSSPIMTVHPGDLLLIEMSLRKTVWTQSVIHVRTRKFVRFKTDLHDQAQVYAYFQIEPHEDPAPIAAVFRDTTIEFSRADPRNCELKNYNSFARRTEVQSQGNCLKSSRCCRPILPIGKAGPIDRGDCSDHPYCYK